MSRRWYSCRWVYWMLCALLVTLTLSEPAHAVTLRVRGASEIDLLVTERSGDVMIRGDITDEVGASLGRVSVKIEAFRPDGTSVALPTTAGQCRADDPTARSASGGTFVLMTDERGAFCALAKGSYKGFKFRASFAGSKLFDAAEATAEAIPEGEQRAQTSLKFEPAPGVVDLEKDTQAFIVSLRISRQDATRLLVSSTKREGLPITLSDERGGQLATATTGGDGRARFEIKSSALDGPGLGELKAEFAGDKQLAPSRTSAAVTRTAVVKVDVAATAAGDPEAGITLEVDVTTKRGAVDGGIVEALRDTEAVGASPVDHGHAKLVATFAANEGGTVPLTLRYVPGPPYFQVGAPASVEIQVKGPSPIRQIILAAVGLALGLWIVTKWRRAPKVDRHDSTAPPPSGRPEILIVDRPSGLRGWRGVVADAHDGTPIAHAELRIVLAVDAGAALATTTTDAEGRFTLEAQDIPREARLVVEGDLHAPHDQPLPSPSVLRVNLITRRRALLDRLVRWARLRGAPYDSAKEPTPGHIRRVAARTGAPPVETWASQVEQAAFGPSPVTRAREGEISQHEPAALPGNTVAPPQEP
ncbi:MAG: carboxypeptidase regulatory-like domain-containing protein [Polyangiaceae bacterium]